jgi:hypothetical protein
VIDLAHGRYHDNVGKLATRELHVFLPAVSRRLERLPAAIIVFRGRGGLAIVGRLSRSRGIQVETATE